MPTPKSLRAAPDRTFENYILTLNVDQQTGLTKVPQEKFSQVSGNAGKSGMSSGLSGDTPIGFEFLFDGIRYSNFNVSVDGWLVLVDPTTTFSASDVLDGGLPYENGSIKSSFLANHSFFAVWWDNLTNTSNDSTLATDLYNRGLSPVNPRINPRKFAIQYCNDTCPEGRRLIVRWHSINSGTTNTRLEFEAVLYENGKIEFKYSPKNQLSIGSVPAGQGATIGIFMPNGTWRFRDFSYELDYQQNQRSKYKFGGTVSGSYVDTTTIYTVPYSVNLTTEDYWPGQATSGAVFTFQPPLNRRKVLPRQTLRERDSRLTLPTVARTGDSRSGNSSIIFDDKKSIVYRSSGLVVNYPSTLPRFYAPETFGVTENQDLFSGEFVVTGGISKSNVQDYLEDNKKSYISPFTENKLFENDPGSDTDQFFTVGSSIQDVGEGFNQSLKSKTQIRLSFRVDHKTTMFGASSSVYYFNSRTSRWQYPTSSFAGGQFDIADPYGDALNLIEVDRGFNAFGFNLASGSSNRLVAPYSTDASIGSGWNRQNETQAIIKRYDKSLQIDQRYSATQDESFTIPIQQPFLLEKAVIELPLEAGPGWFNDKTKCFIPITIDSPNPPGEDSRAFDVGGPGLTVALYNQVSIGPNKTKRDLVLSGTITHQLDDVAEISYSNSPDVSGVNWPTDSGGYAWQIVPQGFRAYATPSAIVNGTFDGSKYSFTGSVTLKCQAQISNGVLSRDAFYITQAYTDTGGGSSPSDAVNALELLFSSSAWPIAARGTGFEDFGASPGFRVRSIVSVNNFGRGCSGFEPSGRSILGKEYSTTQGISTRFYDNPFYLYQGQSTLQNLKNIANGVPDAVFYASSLISRQKSFASPYLVLPGDRLVLSVSKSRPVFFSTEISRPYTSGSIQHDIKLTTGSINITLYGSLVSNGREFHDTLNQSLASDAVHEVVIGETKTW
jgi:hypothetical protein